MPSAMPYENKIRQNGHVLCQKIARYTPQILQKQKRTDDTHTQNNTERNKQADDSLHADEMGEQADYRKRQPEGSLYEGALRSLGLALPTCDFRS